MILTAIIIAFTEILFDKRAAIGDAIALPMTKPSTESQYTLLSKVRKVSELIRAIKKRESFTVPSA